MSAASDLGGTPAPILPIHRVSFTRPLSWLNRGIGDMVYHRGASLAYGELASMFGGLSLSYERTPYFRAAAISGFLLVGPIVTAGLCELSRLRERGEEPTFDASLKVLRRHRSALLRFANVLLLCSVAWFLLSSMMLYIALGSVGPSVESTVWGDVLTQLSATQVVAYIGVGGALAGLVFALSVVSVPMIIDRDVDAVTAMRTSLRVTVADLPAMILWAVMIAALAGFGFVTFLVAMVVIFPLLGHATWFAYRDLVD
jgi:uncharacterized membrane protein